MNIDVVATVAMIAPDPASSRKLYVDTLGLSLRGEGDGYYHSEEIDGCKSFGIWPAL
jgi:catechol 2,3-dioxygenase-like lactoylglutathione lyase family enzyme